MLLRESGAGLHESTFTSDMNPGPGVSWTDLPDTVNAFHLGPNGFFSEPSDITTFPDVSGVGYGKPPLGSGDMVVLPNFAGNFDPEAGGILPEFGELCSGSVACPCLHTETLAGSAPRQFLTSAAGDTSLSDNSRIHWLFTSTPLDAHFTSGGTPGARLFEPDDMILCTQFPRLYALLPEKLVLNVCFGRDLLACLFLYGMDMGFVYCK